MAYAAADIVLCRAGLSTLTELSALKKVAVVVPMPGSPLSRSANRFGPDSSSRATSIAQRSPTMSSAPATGQYWS